MWMMQCEMRTKDNGEEISFIFECYGFPTVQKPALRRKVGVPFTSHSNHKELKHVMAITKGRLHWNVPAATSPMEVCSLEGSILENCVSCRHCYTISCRYWGYHKQRIKPPGPPD
jgi:hypothetical protein